MTLLADLLATVFERRARAAGPSGRDGRTLPELCAALLGATGEVSGGALAGTILDRYESQDDDGRQGFFRHLAEDMGIDPQRVRAALDQEDAVTTPQGYRNFMAAAEPTRQELIRRLNQFPGATPRLVRMRADLLKFARKDPTLKALDLDFQHLLASWFNRGFLVLRPISWQSAASVLEKIIAYEAVHAIDSWDDLRRRLLPADRRCFAFFHPAMPDDPLIFVEVALTKGVPSSIQALLEESREPMTAEAADTAVFYSISNCQPGLAGISFGNSLIKQVASDLSAELSGLKTFVTLSPIPGLVDWLTREGRAHDPAEAEPMRRIAAHYLMTARREDGLPVDPVARFHLGNGALIHDVHAGADTSAKGIRQSGGAMVNYLYDLKKVSQNHERFATRHEIAASSTVRSLSAAEDKNRK
ncbi:malonyl-CoA decarboxylase [Defluviimonas sp. WL0002]|uniref:Malonyl-CoA decarboxylase n=1 Tax=Albidovulum marisflavi TaxID=2984159 RepID=A0ABT2ZET6_9RHOB|nr:malonyl-CoA decarboxylase [Defluviimonas sp. WL0002]MCV2869601.1 malonyl-CoA decarboxylase [Defluviimonas sp. WL0002]